MLAVAVSVTAATLLWCTNLCRLYRERKISNHKLAACERTNGVSDAMPLNTIDASARIYVPHQKPNGHFVFKFPMYVS